MLGRVNQEDSNMRYDRPTVERRDDVKGLLSGGSQLSSKSNSGS